jgi:hypothetical protein
MEETTVVSQRQIFTTLDALVENEALFYPEQVVTELEQTGAIASGNPFPPYSWAKKNKTRACAHGPVFEALRKVLAHPQAKRVLDPDKAQGVDEADPHVLALALHLKEQGVNVTVVTEDRRDSVQTVVALGVRDPPDLVNACPPVPRRSRSLAARSSAYETSDLRQSASSSQLEFEAAERSRLALVGNVDRPDGATRSLTSIRPRASMLRVEVQSLERPRDP